MPSNDYHRYVPKDQRKQTRKRIIWETLISTILIITSIICYVHRRELIGKILYSQIKLAPGSVGFASWLNPPITTVRTYYLFNITNGRDIIFDPKSTTIQCKDTPPYTYNMKTSKTNIVWSKNNKQMSYTVERLFTRDPERFNPSSVNDTGYFINLLRALARTKFETKPAPSFYLTSKYDAFYHQNAVDQLEGFTSDLTVRAQDVMIGPNKDKAGFIYRQNGSGLYNISIRTDSTKKGQVVTFASELVRYNINSPSDYPFPIYDGLTFPPMLFDVPVLNIFNSDFCKPFLIRFNKVVSMPNGMDILEYKLKLVDYNNCTNLKDARTCNEVDKLDVSRCISSELRNNTLFLSKAHFYGVQNETIEKMNINGFTPTSEKHDSFIYFEPYTGTPFKAVFRLQINVDAMIDPMKESDVGEEQLKTADKRGVKRLIPVFWIDQEINISQEVIDKIRKGLFYLNRASYFIIPMAILLAIIIIGIIEVLARRSAQTVRYSRGTCL